MSEMYQRDASPWVDLGDDYLLEQLLETSASIGDCFSSVSSIESIVESEKYKLPRDPPFKFPVPMPPEGDP